MRKLLITIVFLLILPLNVYGVENDNFGEGDRSINQYLNMTESEEEPAENDSEPAADTEEADDEDQDEGQLTGVQSPNLFLLTLQMLLALGAVIFAIYALLKFINKRSRSFNSHSTVQNIGGAGVGANKSVQLVKVGDRLLVVGVGDSVNLLKEIDDPDEIEVFLEKHQASQVMFEQPVSKLGEWLKNRREGRNSERQSSPFHSLLDREMKDVKKSQDKIHSALEEKDR